MNARILNFVEQIEATLLNDIVTATTLELDLYAIANNMIAQNDKIDFPEICQAYEVVKHRLIG
ncbi:hypothetical protein AAGS61_07345 [Lysinibacillus sp. KU-BSD001]|uniref:hypothetical protein n=1 Tax=Lysinibacillus sp. KU-BSD001 TaxID=3141328 RepID=UPI0036E9C71A